MVVTDTADDQAASGTNTPAGDAEDDFFSSWDKPTIKRPSNPPSRSATPGINRSASPFLNAANGNGTARSKSPLSAAEPTEPAAPKAVASSAIRKTATTTAPKKNILGAKKTKLGAKKVDASLLDFDEAEKKAREEAERIEKLGYDPNADTPTEAAITVSQPTSDKSNIVAPTPINPSAGYGQTKTRERSNSEMERLGMGVRRLGFGQVGGGASSAASKPKAAGGFGSTTRSAAAQGASAFRSFNTPH